MKIKIAIFYKRNKDDEYIKLLNYIYDNQDLVYNKKI